MIYSGSGYDFLEFRIRLRLFRVPDSTLAPLVFKHIFYLEIIKKYLLINERRTYQLSAKNKRDHFTKIPWNVLDADPKQKNSGSGEKFLIRLHNTGSQCFILSGFCIRFSRVWSGYAWPPLTCSTRWVCPPCPPASCPRPPPPRRTVVLLVPHRPVPVVSPHPARLTPSPSL